MSNIILSHGGTIVDYVGDEIMAMWGAPGESLTHPEEACKCAAMIQAEVAKLSIEWYPRLMSALEIGIGIHSGMAVCGNTGSKKRIKYGPLGNTVNLASRVQGTTKFLHSAVLITSDTANRISAQLRGRRICKIRVQNMSKPVELYELSMQSAENYREMVRPFNQYYEKALDAFEGGDIQDALHAEAKARLDHNITRDVVDLAAHFKGSEDKVVGWVEVNWSRPTGAALAKIVEQLKGLKLTSPRGPISIDPATRDIVQTVYIRRVEKIGGEYYNVEFDKYPDVKDPGK